MNVLGNGADRGWLVNTVLSCLTSYKYRRTRYTSLAYNYNSLRCPVVKVSRIVLAQFHMALRDGWASSRREGKSRVRLSSAAQKNHKVAARRPCAGPVGSTA